jgi:hypothetical protein
MTRRLLPLALLLLAAGPPPASPKPLTLTKDEGAMLRGFDGRARAIRLQAEMELREVAAEQREYLGRVAARLGVPSLDGYKLDLATLAVEPPPKATPPSPPARP